MRWFHQSYIDEQGFQMQHLIVSEMFLVDKSLCVIVGGAHYCNLEVMDSSHVIGYCSALEA